MTVKELIAKLSEIDENKEVFISCEGGCVLDNNINILQEDNKVLLEI